MNPGGSLWSAAWIPGRSSAWSFQAGTCVESLGAASELFRGRRVSGVTEAMTLEEVGARSAGVIARSLLERPVSG